jgi:hypothetical protein
LAPGQSPRFSTWQREHVVRNTCLPARTSGRCRGGGGRQSADRHPLASIGRARPHLNPAPQRVDAARVVAPGGRSCWIRRRDRAMRTSRCCGELRRRSWRRRFWLA